MKLSELKLPHFLLAAYIIWFSLLAINPYDRFTWIFENIPIVIIVLFFVFTYKKFRFSNTSYIMICFLVFLHTLGGHYTFERVPFGFITDLFGFERNHFDRISHFSVGFYAFPIAEFLYRKGLIKVKTVLFLFGVFSIFTIAALYEIIEWIYAASTNPEAGAAFLGSQGDKWDAQKDMLADGLGSICAMTYFLLTHKSSK